MDTDTKDAVIGNNQLPLKSTATPVDDILVFQEDLVFFPNMLMSHTRLCTASLCMIAMQL